MPSTEQDRWRRNTFCSRSIENEQGELNPKHIDCYSSFIQTLKMLNLADNYMDDDKTCLIASALETNTVRWLQYN